MGVEKVYVTYNQVSHVLFYFITLVYVYVDGVGRRDEKRVGKEKKGFSLIFTFGFGFGFGLSFLHGYVMVWYSMVYGRRSFSFSFSKKKELADKIWESKMEEIRWACVCFRLRLRLRLSLMISLDFIWFTIAFLLHLRLHLRPRLHFQSNEKEIDGHKLPTPFTSGIPLTHSHLLTHSHTQKVLALILINKFSFTFGSRSTNSARPRPSASSMTSNRTS